ncbi:MAG: Flp pilus assembly complex ATPase component TadA [Gemmatimonadetes bacterium]|nr:Flp pilus assembly complex ATPase component TadA [Gemmatimonadota bacterium]
MTRRDLKVARSHAEQQWVALADAVVQMGLVSERDSYETLAQATGMTLVDLAACTPSSLALKLVPERVARRHRLVPLEEDNRLLTYAVSRFDADAERDVAFASGRTPRAVLARPSELADALDRCYPKMADVDRLLARFRSEATVNVLDEGSSLAASESPIIDLCNHILVRAVEAAASDVHIEPTLDGEKVVMRVIDTQAAPQELESLGYDAGNLTRLRAALSRPDGLVLVTGPTGSGKTTALYSALSHLRNGRTNIVSVEDPVKRRVEGVNQIHVNGRAGNTFASVLRSLLRQDPNVIMVGEVRDAEVAQIVGQAAYTGP